MNDIGIEILKEEEGETIKKLCELLNECLIWGDIPKS